MLRQLALQLDILILTWMTNLTTVGLFSGPYRISMALRMIPQNSCAPAISALLTHRALVAGTLQGGLPVERKVFCAYQYSPGRFFYRVVETDPSVGSGR